MTNHIASTSRGRLRAGLLGHLAGRALDHLRLAFSGFIAPELAAEAVRLSAQRAVALLPAPTPTVEPALVGLVEDLSQSGLPPAEPVAVTPAAVAAALATAEPAVASSPDAPKRGGQACDQAADSVTVVQPEAKPVSLRRTVSRQPRKGEASYFAPAADVPSSDLLVAKALAVSPVPTEAAAEGRTEKPMPVDVLGPEIQPTPRARQGVAARGEPPIKAVEGPTAGLTPTETAAALSPGAEKRAGRARNKPSDPVAVPQAQADAAILRRAIRTPRRLGEAVTADRATGSEGSSVNSRVLAG